MNKNRRIKLLTQLSWQSEQWGTAHLCYTRRQTSLTAGKQLEGVLPVFKWLWCPLRRTALEQHTVAGVISRRREGPLLTGYPLKHPKVSLVPSLPTQPSATTVLFAQKTVLMWTSIPSLPSGASRSSCTQAPSSLCPSPLCAQRQLPHSGLTGSTRLAALQLPQRGPG